MKLIIQIPCYNEAETLPITLAALPRSIDGFETVEWLIIDDGSNDNTVSVAKEHGVDHVVQHTSNQGLARAFMTGIDTCLSLGADVIVNTDADNQYDANDIPALTEPVLTKKADIVIGERPIKNIQHFSFIKKYLQKLGSFIVRKVSGIDVADAPSGFRAFNRATAQKLVVFDKYTYTLDTIIQAKQKNMTVMSVPIHVNGYLRPSRLMKNMFSYIKCSLITMTRVFIIYRPFRFFAFIGLILFLISCAIGARFLYYFLSGSGNGHIQSVILAGSLLAISFQTWLVAFLADLIAANRKLLEEIRLFTKTNTPHIHSTNIPSNKNLTGSLQNESTNNI